MGRVFDPLRCSKNAGKASVDTACGVPLPMGLTGCRAKLAVADDALGPRLRRVRRREWAIRKVFRTRAATRRQLRGTVCAAPITTSAVTRGAPARLGEGRAGPRAGARYEEGVMRLEIGRRLATGSARAAEASSPTWGRALPRGDAAALADLSEVPSQPTVVPPRGAPGQKRSSGPSTVARHPLGPTRDGGNVGDDRREGADTERVVPRDGDVGAVGLERRQRR